MRGDSGLLCSIPWTRRERTTRRSWWCASIRSASSQATALLGGDLGQVTAMAAEENGGEGRENIGEGESRAPRALLILPARQESGEGGAWAACDAGDGDTATGAMCCCYREEDDGNLSENPLEVSFSSLQVSPFLFLLFPF